MLRDMTKPTLTNLASNSSCNFPAYSGETFFNDTRSSMTDLEDRYT